LVSGMPSAQFLVGVPDGVEFSGAIVNLMSEGR